MSGSESVTVSGPWFSSVEDGCRLGPSEGARGSDQWIGGKLANPNNVSTPTTFLSLTYAMCQEHQVLDVNKRYSVINCEILSTFELGVIHTLRLKHKISCISLCLLCARPQVWGSCNYLGIEVVEDQAMVRGDISVDNDEAKHVQGLHQLNEHSRQLLTKYAEAI